MTLGLKNIKKKNLDPFSVSVGFRVKQVRQAKKVSQNVLANELSVVTQTIQKYESGEVKIPTETLYKLSCFFDVPVGYFYGEYEQKKLCQRSLIIASEIMRLPNEQIKRNIYNMIKSINEGDRLLGSD